MRHDLDRARVTALSEKVTRAFGPIPRHSEAFCVFPSPEAPRKSAPSGNQMATILQARGHFAVQEVVGTPATNPSVWFKV